MSIPPLQPKGKVEFRIIGNDDDEFLFQLYASTREWEMAHAIMSEGDKDHFLRGQFKLQSQSYATNFIGAVHRIIQLDKLDIGRLIVNRADDHLRIIDLSILSAYRGRGIGTDILRSLLNEAHGGKVPARLHVIKDSPAMRLYTRHGFVPINDRGHYFEMEWSSARLQQPVS